jgi:hypothetical protein
MNHAHSLCISLKENELLSRQEFRRSVIYLDPTPSYAAKLDCETVESHNSSAISHFQTVFHCFTVSQKL